jgi:hypothetical protein
MSKNDCDGMKDAKIAHTGASCARFSLILRIVFVVSLAGACALKGERSGIPAEIQTVIDGVSDDISQERYEKIYNEASDLWKHDTTLEQSTDAFKSLRMKLGKVESRTPRSVTEKHNSDGPLKGHAFIITYQTKFERGDGMETFTLVEQNGHWLLARYLATSTALQ